MTAAALRQRRRIAPLGGMTRVDAKASIAETLPGGAGAAGEPLKFSNTRIGRKLARRAVLEARLIYKSLQVKAAETLRDGMFGLLPGSTASTQIESAKTIANKGGNADATILQVEGKKTGPPLRIAVGMEEMEAAEAQARLEDSPQGGDGAGE